MKACCSICYVANVASICASVPYYNYAASHVRVTISQRSILMISTHCMFLCVLHTQ